MGRKLRLEYEGAIYHVMNRGKVGIAQRLRAETTMTLPWIAQRLKMGTNTYLAHRLYWQGRKKGNR